MSRPSKFAAAATSGSLSLLFMVVYGSCNWITAHRHDVGTWYYSWEHFIPFVPLMIIPYMSIDLFFVAGPFLCQSREELRILTRRIIFAILVAGAFFLLMPLKMGIARPQPSGWTGAIFNFLHAFDQPYNLVPSLHITLRTILADLYARHTKGVTRLASHVWFSLVGFSTVLTYQHHVVDVAGGFVLAAICFYLFRENGARLPVMQNRKIGAYYFAGACACSGGGVELAAVDGRFAVAGSGACGYGNGLLGDRPGNLPENEWSFAIEHAGFTWSLFIRPMAVAASLSPPMQCLGSNHAPCVDWREAERARSRRSQAAGSDCGARFNLRVFREPDVPQAGLPESSRPRPDRIKCIAIARSR